MGSASNALPLLTPQMAAARRCLSLLLLATCVALLLQPPRGASGAPLEPVYPGDHATPEQLAQYAAELRRYINMVTRPRCAPGAGGGGSQLLALPQPRGRRTSLLTRPGPLGPGRMAPRAGRRQVGWHLGAVPACPSCLSPPRYGKRDQEEMPLNFSEWGAPGEVNPW